ncbi:unnamed protein product, partial [Hymenolepis diminuta]
QLIAVVKVTSSNESTGPSKVELSFGIERLLDKDHSEQFEGSLRQFNKSAINENHPKSIGDRMLGNYANPLYPWQLFGSAQLLYRQLSLLQPSMSRNFPASLASSKKYSKTTEPKEPPCAHSRLDTAPFDSAEQPLDLSKSRNIPPLNDSTNLSDVAVTEQSKIQFPHLPNHQLPFNQATVNIAHKSILPFQQMPRCRFTMEQRLTPLWLPPYHEIVPTYSSPLIETSSQQAKICTDVAEQNLNPPSNEPTQSNKGCIAFKF